MRFNFFKRKEVRVSNHEGAEAYKLTPELELYSAVATSGLSDTFYEDGNARVQRIRELIPQTSAAFTARLAIYARTEMYLRSVPLVLAVELARTNSGNPVVSKAVEGIVRRADEITELLACYQQLNGRTGTKKLNKLSRQIQKGLGAAFNNFDEYQFAKYNRSAEVKLRDALFLVHPRAKDEVQQALFNKIATNTLAIPYTWETELSALGQAAYESPEMKNAAFTAKWQELIDSGKLGYMALMRNLRNIVQANVSPLHMQKICARLSDAAEVARAKQLPFRFLAAWREIKALEADSVTMVLNALEDAVVASAANLRGFDNEVKVLVACDVSGSMQKPVSPNSKILLYDIGLMLGMLLQSKCSRIVTGMFGDSWKVINMPNRGVLCNVQEYYNREGEVGYATNGYKVINYLIDNKIKMDKIMLFTDCQLWNSNNNDDSMERSWRNYKNLFPGARLYLFDLAGYGRAPLDIRDGDVYLIAGWSDKVFDVLQAIEDGSNALEKINQVPL